MLYLTFLISDLYVWKQQHQFFSWSTHVFLFFCLSVHPSVCCTPCLRNHTSCDHNFWYTYVKWWHLQGFFLFFKNFGFLGCFFFFGGGEYKENEKYKLHLPHAISQEQYSILSWLLVYLYKMISQGVLSNFSILIFWDFSGVKGEKWPKMT